MARPNRCNTTALAASAHCTSSSANATGPAAHHRSTSSSTASVTTSSWLAAAALDPNACSPRNNPASRATPGSSSAVPARTPRAAPTATNGSRCSSSSMPPRSTRMPSRAHSAATTPNRVVLPIPGSPSTRTADPRPAAACRATSASSPTSESRPIHTGAVAPAISGSSDSSNPSNPSDGCAIVATSTAGALLPHPSPGSGGPIPGKHLEIFGGEPLNGLAVGAVEQVGG